MGTAPGSPAPWSGSPTHRGAPAGASRMDQHVSSSWPLLCLDYTPNAALRASTNSMTGCHPDADPDIRFDQTLLEQGFDTEGLYVCAVECVKTEMLWSGCVSADLGYDSTAAI